jgi:hypothetical protein
MEMTMPALAPLPTIGRPGALAPGALTRTLHVTSPPMLGADVLDLQKALATLGYDTGPFDGVYAVTTAGAVRAFQSARGLEVDGIAGPQTVRALEQARPRPDDVPVAAAGQAGPGVAALAEGVRHLGLVERPVNRTMFGDWFGVDGVPWCNVFVSYCFATGAGYKLCSGFEGAGVYPKGCSYVPTTEAWLRATGMWIGRAAPRPGDIAIYRWDAAGEAEHIGIVEKNLGGGRFQAIEGNTSLASNSNGGAVMRRHRSVHQVSGFGRVHT